MMQGFSCFLFGVWGFWFCRGLILFRTYAAAFFYHFKCCFVHISYFSGVRLVLHCDRILSIFFYDGLNRIKAFMNTLKFVTANCQTKTDCGPFLSLSFF